ncbi:MAG TPA: hypothetical protein VJ654_14640 [Noviherbaspirillum sp.]|nr:hypothetical protein [Noviherbaspirillum sp.]
MRVPARFLVRNWGILTARKANAGADVNFFADRNLVIFHPYREDGRMDCKLTDAEINHLRRLLGYVRCEIGQEPDEIVSTVKKIAPAIGDISEEGKKNLVEWHDKSSSVPKYVRAAVKALEKTIVQHQGEILDAGESRVVREITSKFGPEVPDVPDVEG